MQIEISMLSHISSHVQHSPILTRPKGLETAGNLCIRIHSIEWVSPIDGEDLGSRKLCLRSKSTER